jgi:ABC-type oligopeptide transport system substrate-binding subunit
MSTFRRVSACFVLLGAAVATGCTGLAGDGEYFGQTVPPEGQHLRYISGSEPQTLDPHQGTGQPEARIYAALYEGLIIYDPQTAGPYPGVAELWDSNEDNTEFTFYLQPDARWSNGDPLTAHDFVYSLQRALAPEVAARSSYMAYEIRYAQAYNSGEVFLRDPQTGTFLLQADLGTEGAAGADVRVTLPSDREAWPLEGDAALASAVVGKEPVPVSGEDIGIEALDDLTVRFSLVRPAPYFVGMLAHQFFMPVHRETVEAYGDEWARLGRIVGNGPFILDEWRPYNDLVVVRNPTYWDASSVRLDSISFYPLEEQTTMMNLYKAGEVDAFLNHTVPLAWLDVIGQYRDHLNEPENGVEYYALNVNRPPMDNVLVRKAFNAAIDKDALGAFRRDEPLTTFMPGIYPAYPTVRGDEFDPARARQLLAEAGYADAQGAYDPSTFPINEIELLYNTNENNRQAAEFVQSEWSQNLDLTVPLRNMEWQTYIDVAYSHEYRGIVRSGWAGDYLDPFTFLGLLQDPNGNMTGWDDQHYRDLLEQANYELDPIQRYELLAEAEAYMLDQQPVIPLFAQTTNWMKKPYVMGMYANPITIHSWKHVYIEHDPTKWDEPAETVDR